MRDFIRLGGILFIITAAVALVLATGNNLTKDKIEALTEQAETAAQQQVMQGAVIVKGSETVIDVKEGTSVKAITKYTTEGGEQIFAVACSPKGYGDEISMMVGVDQNLKVTGVSIIDNSKETPGLGSKVSEPKFYEQYIGKNKGIEVNKNQPKDNEVQAVTGATISSRAVTNGVNDAIKLVGEVLGK